MSGQINKATDDYITRMVTFRMYPRSKQESEMVRILGLHCDLYNAALQERRDAHRMNGIRITYGMQAKSLTEVRSFDSDYKSLNAQSEQATLRRVDRAFKNFFERQKKGKPGGYPRFQSKQRFSGWSYNAHGDGYKLLSDGKNGNVRISGVGLVRLRGEARVFGTPTAATISRKNGKWFLSICMRFDSVEQLSRQCGTEINTFDWGVETFLTGSNGEEFWSIDNPRLGRSELGQRLKYWQRELARKKKGSRRFKQIKKIIATIHEKLANKRKDFSHKESTKIVSRSAIIGTEELNIQVMTSAGRTDTGNPRKTRKRHLNREILDTAPSMFIQFIKYKAEEAGAWYVDVPTRTVKPSQRCSGCDDVRKKDLSERIHSCKRCGLTLGRDQNSAATMHKYVLNIIGPGTVPFAETNVG